MTTRQKIERLIYAAVIVLSAIVVILAALSASFLVDTRVVYQGF